jgi:hypothetical protein
MINLGYVALHLTRATQRSMPDGMALDEERDEVLLHYVIALEALLADEEQADLARKVTQRAAVLVGDDDSARLRYAALIRSAYTARSKYAHGDEPHQVDLAELRMATCGVMLRWLVLQAAADRNRRLLPELLDDALLSARTRAEVVDSVWRSFTAEINSNAG